MDLGGALPETARAMWRPRLAWKGGIVFRFRQRLREQKGFALVEVAAASIVMVAAMIPIIKMFDGSMGSTRQLTKTHATVACAQTAAEQIKAIPFYKPYGHADQDIDDFFWGERSPVNSNPASASGAPDWSNIPELTFKDYGQMQDYPDYRAGVRLAYLKEDTGLASLSSSWGPEIEGHDKPVNDLNDDIHLLLIQVNVHWKVDGEETGLYALHSTVTDSQASYNLGITRINVTGPDNLKGSWTNAASHYPAGSISVSIDGWGFDPATVSASLVRTDSFDIPITLLGTPTDNQIQGTLNLGSTGTVGHPWSPRADIGLWSVKVKQKSILSVYLYEGFIVEYPKPVISDFFNKADNSKEANDVAGPFVLHIDGSCFVYLVEKPTVRLVQVVSADRDPAIITGTGVTCSGASSGYADSGCVLAATFDPTGKPCGEYRVEVINTEPGTSGHVSSGLSSQTFNYTNGRPQPTDISDAGGPSYAYNNAANPWRLTISGSTFNHEGASPQVQVALCSSVAGEAPSGNWIMGTLVSVTSSTIVADFNLSSLPAGYYGAWVKNMNNNAAGWSSTQPFQVLSFGANISDFSTDAGYGFYENYWDVHATISGSGLGLANQVRIAHDTESYDITSDCTLGDDDTIPVNLNLIDCHSNSGWKIQVYYPWGSYIEGTFTVGIGPAKILMASNARPAIRIHAIRGSGDQWNVETASAQAWAWRTTRFLWTTYGYGTFEVHGKGFLNTGGQTTLRVWSGSWNPDAQTINCVADRAAKDVYITSSGFTMPETAGTAGISVQNTAGNTAVDSYTNRWSINN